MNIKFFPLTLYTNFRVEYLNDEKMSGMETNIQERV